MKAGPRSLFTGRPALIALIFYISGILLAVNLDLTFYIPLIFSIVVFFAVAAAYFSGRYTAAGWLLVIALIGLGWYLTESATNDFPPNHISRFAAESGQVELIGDLIEEPDSRSGRVYLVIEADSVRSNDRWFPTLGTVRVSVKGKRPLFEHGDRLRLSGFLYQPAGPSNPGGFDYGAYLWSKKIFAAMSVTELGRAETIARNGTFVSRIVSPLRDHLISLTNKHLSPVSAAVLSGFILGERRDIPDECQELFRNTGTLHLMAVSGSNVALVLALFAFPLTLSRIPRSYKIIILLIITAFFALLTRLEPSVVRASIMAAIGLIAYGWIRKPDYVNLLAFAGLLMLLWNPLALFDIGLQLSFAATFGIIFAIPRLLKILPRPSNLFARAGVWIMAILLSTIAAQAAVLPLMAHYFGNLPLSGALANIPIGLAASTASSLGIGFYFTSLAGGWPASLLAIPLEWLLRLTISTLGFFASLPYANIKIASPGILAMAIFWILIYLLYETLFVKRFSFRSIITVIILFNLWLWIGLLRKQPDWSLEFFDLGYNHGWLFTAKGQPSIACLDSYIAQTDADDIITPHILDYHNGQLGFILSGTPDSSDVARLASEFGAFIIDINSKTPADSPGSPTPLLQGNYKNGSNFPAAVKIIWGLSDNRGGGKDLLPMLQIDVGDGRIVLADRTGAGTLDNLQVHSRLIALELPWSCYSHSSSLKVIQRLSPNAILFSPDNKSLFLPRRRSELTHSASRVFATSLCGAFAISGIEGKIRYETMRPYMAAGD